MLFDFDEEQFEFRGVVRSMLDQHMPASSLRKTWNCPSDEATPVWSRLADLGLFGLIVDEQFGGLGGDFVDVALSLEEVGAHSVPEPILETIVTAAALGRWAPEEVRKNWLPRLANGDVVVAFSPSKSGLVPFAARADAHLVVVDEALHLVPSERVRVVPVESMDPSLRIGRCSYEFDETTLISGEASVVSQVHALAATVSALMLVGLSSHLVTMTRDYLLERKQFGQLLGSFQALKHRLADVAVATEAARGLAWYAAYAVAHLPDDVETAAHLAKGSASRAANLAGSAALQLHGGIGFTWEHDLHLWLQRGKALEALFGSMSQHREGLAERVFAS